MKKILFAVAALLALLSGCSNNNAPASPAATVSSPAAALPEAMNAVENISADQVAYIDYFDARSPDGVAAVTYSKADDVQNVLGWLSQLRLTGQAEPQNSAAPGTWSEYQVKLFNGDAMTVSFNQDTVTFDGGNYTFEDPSGSNPGDTVYTIWMAPQHRDYPTDTGEIIVELFNQTGSEIGITFAPKLEKADADGWREIACQGAFCGTSEPVDIPVSPMTIDMKTWYPSSTPGTYRLTLDALDENFDPITLSCVFELT